MHYLAPLETHFHSLQQTMGFRSYSALMVGSASGIVLVLCLLLWLLFPKYTSFILKNLRRNLLRTILAGLAVMVLALVVTIVWSFLVPLDAFMTEQTSDIKIVVSERWQIPSQMPPSYATTLEEGGYSRPGDLRLHREDSMTWAFFGGTVNPNQTTFAFDDFVFFFVLDPRNLIEREIKDENGQVRKVPPMMDDLEHTDAAFHEAVQKMLTNKQAVIMGRERLAKLNKRVGDRIKVYSFSYRGIDLEVEVVGVFPDLPRYNQIGAMNRDYLQGALDAYPLTHNGNKHPLAGKNLNLVWLRVADTPTYSKLANQIMSSALYTDPAVKTETAASGTASWLEAYKDIFFGVKWFLVPVLLLVMALVMAMAISISVRERRTEMAVLKVLGFTPGRIMGIVLGEAVIVGALAGFLTIALGYTAIQCTIGGIPFQIAWFAIWPIPADALWWGPVFGAVTSLLGSLFPAWSARRIKVSEVFAKVA